MWKSCRVVKQQGDRCIHSEWWWCNRRGSAADKYTMPSTDKLQWLSNLEKLLKNSPSKATVQDMLDAPHGSVLYGMHAQTATTRIVNSDWLTLRESDTLQRPWPFRTSTYIQRRHYAMQPDITPTCPHRNGIITLCTGHTSFGGGLYEGGGRPCRTGIQATLLV